MNRLEQAIELGTEIKDLRAKIEDLEAEVAQKERSLAGLLSRTRTPRAPNRNGNVAIDNRPIDDRVWDALKKSKDLMDAQALKNALPDIKIESIRASLSRMVGQGRASRMERGQYQEAYPSAAVKDEETLEAEF